MAIHMKQLSSETYRALEFLSCKRNWPDIQAYMEPELIAWLAFKLEREDDDEVYFPKGKWATIQRLQDMLRTEAREPV